MMKKKISIVTISAIVAILFMSGGYGYWQKDITIIGNITVLEPVLESQSVEEGLIGTGGREISPDKINTNLIEEDSEKSNPGSLDTDDIVDKTISDSNSVNNAKNSQEQKIYDRKEESSVTVSIERNSNSTAPEITETTTGDATPITSSNTDNSTSVESYNESSMGNSDSPNDLGDSNESSSSDDFSDGGSGSDESDSSSSTDSLEE